MCDLKTQMSDDWKNFDSFLDLYQFWFTLFLNANLYSLGIAGGMFSFLLDDLNDKNVPLAKVGLLLPGGICFIMAIFFFVSFFKQKNVQDYAEELRNNCEIRKKYIPSIFLFRAALISFGLFQVAVAAACFIVAFKYDYIIDFLT